MVSNGVMHSFMCQGPKGVCLTVLQSTQKAVTPVSKSATIRYAELTEEAVFVIMSKSSEIEHWVLSDTMKNFTENYMAEERLSGAGW